MARTFELNTPLGADVLLFHRLQAREELSRLSDFQIDALSIKADINVDDILGKNVTVKVELADEQLRHFNGYVTRFAQVGIGRYHAYQAIVRPWLWFLTRTADCRIFQQKTVPDILKKMFDDHPTGGFQVRADGDLPEVGLLRAIPGNGLQLHQPPDGAGRHLLLLQTPGRPQHPGRRRIPTARTRPARLRQFPIIPQERMTRPEQERISTWNFDAGDSAWPLRARRLSISEKPSVDLAGQDKLQREHANADYEVYDYPGEYLRRPTASNTCGAHRGTAGPFRDGARAHQCRRRCSVGYLSS